MSSQEQALPDLPLELVLCILRWCDPPTLASAAGGSFALLELASPLLYTHVVLNTTSQVNLLFRERNRKSALARYLSLSQMRTLHVLEDQDHQDSIPVDESLLGRPLLLDRLSVTVHTHLNATALHDGVLPFVAPIKLVVHGDLRRADAGEYGVGLPALSLENLQCSRLRALQATNAAFDLLLSDLPVTGLVFVAEVTSQLNTFAWTSLMSDLVADLGLPSRTADGDGDFPCRGMSVQLWADTDARADALRNDISARAALTMDAVTVEKRMAKITIGVRA